MKKTVVKKDGKVGQILGITLNSTSKERVLSVVRAKISQSLKFLIVTPNPEILLQAQNDPKLKQILNSADLSLPDGFGLILAARFLGLDRPREVIKGREIFLELIRLANKKGWRVFLLGARPGVAEEAAKNLQRSFKKVKISFHPGPRLDQEANPVTEIDRKVEIDLVEQINQFKPHFLFIAFGAPKQEKWIANHEKELKIGGAMVVGGTLDYFAGKMKLPPKWMEKTHLEWFWRLIQQPQRIPRIIKATVIFPLKVFLERITR